MSPSPEYLAEDGSGRVLQTCIAFMILETFFMSLLYISRALSKQKKTNWTMILLMTGAYVVCMFKITIALLMIQIGGAGRHLVTVPSSTIRKGLKLNLALQIICPLATSLSKLGVLSLFYNLFGSTSRNYRIVIRATSVLVLAILITLFLIPFANCKPLSYNWNKKDGAGSCAIAPLSLWRYLSIPSVVTTVMVVCIPIPALYRLKISPAAKVGLAGIFIVCLGGVAAAFLRFFAFLRVDNFHDITYEQVKPLSWTITESGIYLIAGVLPTLQPLARKVCGDGVFDRICSASFRGSRGSTFRGSRRWSRLVLRGESAEKVEEKQEKVRVDVCAEASAGDSEDEEKGRISKDGQASL